jgi:beta-galactosidase
VSPEFEVEFTAARTARESLPEGARFTRLPTRDEVGAASGFVLYRTPIEVAGRQVLQLAEVRDRALVSIEGEPVGTLMRGEERAIALPSDASGWLEPLVEDLGRVSYGPRIGEAKGLIGPVTLGGVALTDWEVAPLDLELMRTQPSTAVDGKPPAGPVFAHTEFELEQQLDLFLDTAWFASAPTS